MTTERAGGLSTAAIEAVIWYREAANPGTRSAEAARAELAALTGRVAELTTVLGLARDTFAALRSGLQDEFWPGRAVSAEDGLAMFRLLDEAARGVEDALADAGPGAAGARDETPACEAFVAWLGREGLSVCAWEEFDADRRTAEQAPGEWRPLEATAVLARWLDGPRAGGAGDEEG